MTHKDYKLIAEILSKFEEQQQEKIHENNIDLRAWWYACDALFDLRYAFADALEADNPRFNYKKFTFAVMPPSQQEMNNKKDFE